MEVNYSALIVLIGILLVAGLMCVWVAVSALARMASRNQIVKPQPKAEEEGPRLTRLGRPIEEVRMN